MKTPIQTSKTLAYFNRRCKVPFELAGGPNDLTDFIAPKDILSEVFSVSLPNSIKDDETKELFNTFQINVYQSSGKYADLVERFDLDRKQFKTATEVISFINRHF